MFNHFQRYKNIPSDKKNPPPNGRFPAFHDNFCNKMFFDYLIGNGNITF